MMNFSSQLFAPNKAYNAVDGSMRQASVHAALATALDVIACGILILDERMCLIHANVSGQMQLAESSIFKLGVDHLLSTQNRATQQALVTAFNQARAGKRSMLSLQSENSQSIAVIPLDQGHSNPLKSQKQDNGMSRQVALIFSRHGMCENLMMGFFSRAHQLTHAEEQVLNLVSTGQTAPQMANELHVKEATVRSHIRSICYKTNSQGIRQLVKRLATLPPLMARAYA